MKYVGIKKGEEGAYITRYDVQYKTEDGQDKNYEIISRKNNIETFEQLHGDKADAVVLIMTSPDGERILLNKEFRMAAGMWVINFPAGLIDPDTLIVDALSGVSGMTILGLWMRVTMERLPV